MITRKFFTYALLCCLFSLASATAWADDGFDLTANPENGSTVTELSSFTVCGYVEYMDLYDWDTRVEVVKDGVTVAYADYDGVGENAEGYNEVSFAIDNEDWDAITLTEAGEYTIVIPANYLKGGDEEAVYNNATTLTYIIGESAGGETDGSEGFDLTFNPENGATVTELSSFTACGYVEYMDLYDWDTRVEVVKDGVTVAYADYDGVGENAEGYNEVSFAIDNEDWDAITLTEAGEYTIVIPANYLKGGDEVAVYNKAVTLTYTIGEGGSSSVTPEEYSYTVTPEAGELTEATSTITINCATGMYVVDGLLSNIKVYKDGELYTTATSITPETDDNEMLYDIGETLELGTALSEAGEYEVVIPAGFFYYFVDGRTQDIDMGEITIQYTISEDIVGGDSEGFDLTIDPENGSTLSQFNSFSLCGNSDDMDVNDWDAILYVVKDGEVVAIANNYGNGVDEAGNNVFYYNTVDPDEWEDMTLTDEGTYTIEIPSGLFHIGDALSNAVTLTYTIGEGGGSSVNPDDYSYTVTPEAGELTEATSTITINCATGMYVADGTPSSIKVYKDGELYTTATNITPEMDDNWMLYDIGEAIELETAISEEGEYEVVIPSGFFYYFVDGRTNDIDMGEIRIAYTISEGGNEESEGFDLTFDPENGSTLTELNSLTICGNSDELDLNIWDALSVLKDGEIVAYADWDGMDTNDEGYNVATYSIVDPEEWESMTLTEAGTYTIEIPAGLFHIGDALSNAVTLTYTISETNGINSINAALSEGINEIYSLSGQRIQSLQSGKVNIVKLSDGSVKKIIVK